MTVIEDGIPRIVHDTLTILDVNDAACQLFDAERSDLVDQRLIDGVYRGDMQFLAGLRLKVIKEKGELPEQDLPFLRLNGTAFWARCKTTKNDDGTYTTEINHLYEY